jgi:L-ascorbate metabolism protein UlaG (beta-lactamase superfamily)
MFMKPLSAMITHLYHSGFAVETINHHFIFDYTEPAGILPAAPLSEGSVNHTFLAENDNIYVFITHHHQDHFMPAVLTWQEINPDIHIIAGYDVPMEPGDNCHLMEPYQKLKINEVMIESYGSTDAGISFYVQADHLSFFHAGDLNWWHWKEFLPEEQLREERDFKQEIQRLQEKKIDVAFIPVDPRLEEAFSLAGEYVLEKLKPALLVPMHFGSQFQVTRMFAREIAHASSSIAVIEKRGQQIYFNKS